MRALLCCRVPAPCILSWWPRVTDPARVRSWEDWSGTGKERGNSGPVPSSTFNERSDHAGVRVPGGEAPRFHTHARCSERSEGSKGGELRTDITSFICDAWRIIWLSQVSSPSRNSSTRELGGFWVGGCVAWMNHSLFISRVIARKKCLYFSSKLIFSLHSQSWGDFLWTLQEVSPRFKFALTLLPFALHGSGSAWDLRFDVLPK